MIFITRNLLKSRTLVWKVSYPRSSMSEVEREAGLQSRRAHDANAHASISEVEREAQNLAKLQRRRSRPVHWVHNPC